MLEFEMTSSCATEDSSDTGTEESKETDSMDKESNTETMDSDLWSNIPDELLEKIIARLPLRFLFQSRILSTSWATKMECGLFQDEVGRASTSCWTSYCPLYVGSEGLIGYDIQSGRCEKLLTLSYLPYPRAALIRNTRGKISGAGPLMCFVDCDYFPNVYITNVITRKWKILPSRPDMTYPAIVHLLLVGSNSYKVILITPQETPCSQIYDSVTNSWSIRDSETAPSSTGSPFPAAGSLWVTSNRAWISANNGWTNSAYFRGILYVLWGYQYDGPCELLAYNVEEGTWMNILIDEIRPSLQRFEFVFLISMSRIVVCADDVIVVIRLNISSTDPEDIRIVGTAKENLVVFKLDFDSRKIREISRGPPLPLFDTDLNEAASDNGNIYFYQKLAPNSAIVVYNVREKEWSCLPPAFNVQTFREALKKRKKPLSEFFFQPTTFSFQPGHNPFARV